MRGVQADRVEGGHRSHGDDWRAATRSARATLRRGWLGVVVTGILLGTAGAASAALVAGARRTDAAYQRLHDRAQGADALVFASQVDIEDHDVDWAPLIARPEVASAAAYALLGHTVDGKEGMFTFAPGDDRGLYRSIEVPFLRSGRLPRAGHRDDEVVVSEVAHRDLDIDLGDELTYRTQLESDEDGFHGPVLHLKVVGIGDIPLGFTRYPTEPIFYLSSTFLLHHPEVPRATNLLVRLRHGSADLPALRAHAKALLGTDVPVLDLHEAAGRVRRGTQFESTGLLVLAVALAAVGAMVAGQSMIRTIDAAATDGPILRALGLTRLGRTMAFALPALPMAGVAALTTVVGGVVLSPALPIGLARRLDPDVGLHADWPVLLLAVLLTVVVVVVVVGTASWFAARPPEGVTGRTSATARRLGRLPLPVVVGMGVRLALDPADRRTGGRMRPVMVATVLGLAGVVGAVTISAGLDDALAVRARTGQFWEGFYFTDDHGALRKELLSRGDVEGAARAGYAMVPVGDVTVATFTIAPIRGRGAFTVLSGKAPHAPNEVVLGPATARRFHVSVGDVLAFGHPRRAMRVTGTGLLLQTPAAAYDEGAWVTPAGLAQLAGEEAAPALLIHFRDDGAGLPIDPLPSRQGTVENELETEAQVVGNLRRVGRLPWIDAAFFALLTIGSVAHLLTSSGRHRRRDIATLRCLGMTPRQIRATVGWQGLTLAVVGLVIGVPLGLAGGTTLWRAIAHGMPIVYAAPIPARAIAITVPATLAIVALLAVRPARRAARLSPADAGRAERP